ncbi:MAG: T9SS type A sorting domain-containing protein [Ignavibacteria bacterium]|nr:T9SS type A sorting domain-containing protein [Ignavibacteria bacterium]
MKVLLGLNKGSKLVNNEIPRKFELYQNYPNPFNPITNIKFDLPKDAQVTIKIYDLLGREVANLVKNEMKKSGTHHVKWNAGNLASGVYFYRIEAGNFVQSKKMVLVK